MTRKETKTRGVKNSYDFGNKYLDYQFYIWSANEINLTNIGISRKKNETLCITFQHKWDINILHLKY